ncbi:hypothetical protein DL767_000096 [Monosporascus sp. MG133]|nr:hypothetical protein DL767_000096 [Monosporascus sp. MG133]
MAPRYDPPGRNGNNKDGAGGVIGAISRFWTHSYAPDYLGFAGLLTAYLLINFLVEPFHRLFFINDLRISFPHAEVERVPVWLNFVYALFVPLGVLLFWNAVVARASFHKQHSAVLGLAISLVLASFLTDVVKNTVGRPRPDLVARCKPAAGTAPNVLVSIDVCTETAHHTLHDGWRSFPSGHSSFSFAGLGYLAFFLAGQLRVFRDRRDLGRALLCLAPLLGAALIAISRCQDYRHDVYDVCVGSALGFLVAWFAYRRYWPRLSSRDCDEPYPTPGSDLDERDREGWRRVRDEEEGGGAAAGPILGRSAGFGKPSIISLLEQLYDIRRGQILASGIEITDIDLYEYRKQLSPVAQEPTLFQGTLRQNILLGVDPKSVADEQLRAVSRDASNPDFIASLPDGYDPQIGSQGISLSGSEGRGHRQSRFRERETRAGRLREGCGPAHNGCGCAPARHGTECGHRPSGPPVRV